MKQMMDRTLAVDNAVRSGDMATLRRLFQDDPAFPNVLNDGGAFLIGSGTTGTQCSTSCWTPVPTSSSVASTTTRSFITLHAAPTALNRNDLAALKAVQAGDEALLGIPETALRAKRVPILAIVGELDWARPDAEAMVEIASNAEIEVIPAATHLNALSHPLLLDAIVRFLASIRASSVARRTPCRYRCRVVPLP